MVVIACSVIISSLVPAAFGASFQLRAAGRVHSFASLRYSPEDPAARTLLKLDTNQDGRIDPSEIAAFARSQNLNAGAATEEFASIDLNDDGVLDSKELTQALGAPAPPAAAMETTAAAKEASVTTAASTDHFSAAEAPLVALPSPIQTAPVDGLQRPMSEVLTASTPASLVMSKEVGKEEGSQASALEAAQKVAAELELEESELKHARELDRTAAEMSANSNVLAKDAVKNALDAGSMAAHKKASELLTAISKLEGQAERSDAEASAFLAKSKLEAEEAHELMTVVDKALPRAADDGTM